MKRYLLTLLCSGLAWISVTAQSTAKEWFDKGTSLKKSKNYKEAIDAFKKASNLQANYSQAYHQLGWCYNEEGMYNEAIEALKKEEKAGPSDKASNLFEQGYAQKGLKNYNQAIIYFDQAIDLDEDYGLAYKERGNCYYKNKDYEKALPDFNKYEELEEDIFDEEFYYHKGWVENDLEKYTEAAESLNKAIDLEPDYSDALTELGYAYYKLNLNDDAIRNYRKAMQVEKELVSLPILGLADVYYVNLKNYDSAIVYYEKGLKIKKTGKLSNYRLGWCYNDKERYNDALEPLKQAILIDADYADARIELGYAYYKLERYDEALSQFRPIINKDSKDELARYYAGFCYYKKSDQANLKKMIDDLTALNSTKYVDTLKKYVE